MVTDEFSFPTITDPVPRLAASSPLWRISSDASVNLSLRDIGREKASSLKTPHERYQRKSCSSIERSSMTTETTEDDEEKMDMLWEDFNDELKRTSSLDRKKVRETLSKGSDYSKSNLDGVEELVDLYCVLPLKLPKTNSSMFSQRRPSLLVLLKVLKKLFLLHNSRYPKKSSTS